MDLRDGPEYEEFRSEVAAFLEGWPLEGKEAELPLEEQERLFRQRGIEHLVARIARLVLSRIAGLGRFGHWITLRANLVNS